MGFGAELGRVFIEVRAKLDNLKSDFDKATATADDSMRSMGSKIAKHGDTLSKTLTPVMGAFGLASRQAFNEYDAGADTLIAKTGAGGAQLDALEGSMKKVAGTTTSSFQAIAGTVGDLNSMLGLTGKPLDEIAGKITKLQEMGQPVDAQAFARFMGDWSIKNEDAAASLDKIYTISQKTGQPVNELLQLIVQFGAPLRSLGFGVDESALMLAKWHKEGVNVETLLAGMKMGLGKIASGMGDTASRTIEVEKAQRAYNEAVKEHGPKSLEARDAQLKLADAQKAVASGSASIPEAFAKTVKSIQGAKTESEAFTIAIDAFGKRAGPDFAKAVLEGRFNLDELRAATDNSTGSIDKAYKATLDFSDKLEMWKNRVIGVVGPLGEVGMAIGGIGAAVGPVLSVGGRLIAHFAGTGAAAAAATPAIVAEGGATVGAGAAAAVGSGGFFAFAAALWATLAPVLAVIAVIALLILAGYLLVRNWDTVKAGLAATLDWLLDHWKWVVGAILAIALGPLGAVIGLIIGHWDKVKRTGGAALDWLTDRWNGFTSWLTNIPNRLGNWADRMWDGLADGFRRAWNSVANLINRTPHFTLPGIFGGGEVGLPHMPILGEGGRITEGGMAVVGERGKETVWLPAGAEVDKRSRGRGPAGEGGGTTYVIYGSVVTERQLARLGRSGLADSSRYNGTIGFS